MIIQPINHEGYKLFHEGCIALSQVEANGIRIDTDYLNRAKQRCKNNIRTLEESLKKNKIFQKWQNEYGLNTNLGSREQLGRVLFEVMDFPCEEYTKTGRPSTSDTVLRHMNIPFVKNYLKMERWKKSLNTFLRGIERETIGGFLHPFFNLNTVVSFRSSSDSPDSQNWPVRNPEIAKLIRTAFIPRSHRRHIAEFDFKGIEVSVAACYNKDPNLIRYVSDNRTDMHRDMAMQCYLLKKKQVTKNIRYAAKNRFTFPEFYNNWYKSVTKDLWRAIQELKLTTTDEIPLKKHLLQKGIKSCGKCNPEEEALPRTFEYHIKQVEKDFWN